jgi:type I restriction enzyme S subunit
MVLRAKPEVVLPEFLPFFMQSDRFMARALEISVGSLSPTINWKTLAAEEFVLPPIEEQRRMAEVLNAALATQDKLHRLACRCTSTVVSLIESQMRGLPLGQLKRNDRVGRYHGGWPLVPLDDLLDQSQYGLSEVASEQGRYPMLRMMNLENGYAVENDIVFIDLDDRAFERYRLHRGNVLFNRTNSYELVGRTGVYELDGDHVFASYLVRLRTKPDRLDSTYLCSFLNAPVGRRQVMSFATRGVSQTNVNASNLGRVLVPLPPLDYQQRTVAAIRASQGAAASLGPRSQKVRRLVAQILGERTAR